MARANMFAVVPCVILASMAGGFGHGAGAATAHAPHAAHPARAAAAGTAPANDTASGATVVSALPFTQTLDTSGATTDSDDAQANQSCGAPATNNSVWYKFTAGPHDSLLAVDTTGSNFSSGVLIATGTPGALTTEDCSPVSIAVTTKPGASYYVMAFDDTGSGGTLRISMHGRGPVPKNDKLTGVQTVKSLPFKTTLDTTGATTDRSDTQVNASCGAPSTSHSVWYKYTAGAKDTGLFFDAGASTFDAGVIVATAANGGLKTVACGPSSVSTAVTPGTTYYVLVFDAGVETGGTLNFTIDHLPTWNTNVRTRTLVDSSGVAQLTGSYNCTNSGTRPFSDISGQIVQVIGDDRVVTGSADPGPFAPTCDGRNHTWTASITPSPSTDHFKVGKAAALTASILCNNSACTVFRQNVVVNLARTRGGSTGAAPVTSSNQHTTSRVPHKTWGTVSPGKGTPWGR